MNVDLLKQYAALKILLRQTEETLDTLQPEVLKEVKDFIEANDGKLPEVDGGVFTIVQRKLWKYTERVTELELDLKNQKHEEQARGEAEVEVKETVMFRGKDNTNESGN